MYYASAVANFGAGFIVSTIAGGMGSEIGSKYLDHDFTKLVGTLVGQAALFYAADKSPLAFKVGALGAAALLGSIIKDGTNNKLKVVAASAGLTASALGYYCVNPICSALFATFVTFYLAKELKD